MKSSPEKRSRENLADSATSVPAGSRKRRATARSAAAMETPGRTSRYSASTVLPGFTFTSISAAMAPLCAVADITSAPERLPTTCDRPPVAVMVMRSVEAPGRRRTTAYPRSPVVVALDMIVPVRSSRATTVAPCTGSFAPAVTFTTTSVAAMGSAVASDGTRTASVTAAKVLAMRVRGRIDDSEGRGITELLSGHQRNPVLAGDDNPADDRVGHRGHPHGSCWAAPRGSVGHPHPAARCT